MKGVLIRAVLYALFALLLGEIVRWEATLDLDLQSFKESGIVQWIQSAFLLLCSLLAFFTWRNSKNFRDLSFCMGLFFLALLIRENDQTLEWFLPHGVWKYFVTPLLILLVGYFWKKRQEVFQQITEYAHSFSFGVLISGFMVLTFSRLFGQKKQWVEVMGEGYTRIVKNAVEESVELLALGLILAAVVEFAIAARNGNS